MTGASPVISGETGLAILVLWARIMIAGYHFDAWNCPVFKLDQPCTMGSVLLLEKCLHK